jgi:oxygen-independent coproporphyrinogen-3 oxidase
MLSPEQFEYLDLGIQRHFGVGGVREFSIEANPDSVDEERIEAWLRAGINRISLGVQSFDDTVLGAAGRVATEADIFHAVGLFRENDVPNFGIDLILGLQSFYPKADPDRVFSLFRIDLEKTVNLHPKHISVYMLSISDETTLGRLVSRSNHSLPDDSTLEEMYLYAVDYLTGHGYIQYEVSNFAIPGYESLHNRNYWRGEEYIGLGLGAVSTVAGRRTWNREKLEEYTALVCTGKSPFGDVEMLDHATLWTERIMLLLRMAEGMDMGVLMQGLSEQRANRLQTYLSSLFEYGLAERRGSHLALTAHGFLKSNTIIADIVRVTDDTKNRHS